MSTQDDDRRTEARAHLLNGTALLDRCLESLQHRPSAVITDIDGTISEIARTPDAAVVSTAARAALDRLTTVTDLVGVVTGRSAEDGERLVGLPTLLYVGNHGLERRAAGVLDIHPGAGQAIQAIAEALDDIRQSMEREGLLAGLVFENKRLSASIHYRVAEEPTEVGRRLLALALAAARGRDLRVTEGRNVVELRPNLTVNKGTAVADLIARHQLRGIVFLGDDVTDVDAFRVVQEQSRQDRVAGCVVAVSSPEVHPSVLNEADGVVEDVDEAVQLLATIADRLSDAEPTPATTS